VSTREHTLARLHLRAVLPTLAALVSLDEDARAIIAGRSFSVKLRTLSGVATRLDIHDGTISVNSEQTGRRALHLLFLDDRSVNKIFLGTGFSLPIPTAGFRYLLRLRTFARLADRLRRVLDASSRQPDDAMLAALSADLLVANVLPACVTELARGDAETRRLLEPFGNALIALAIEGGPSSWMELRRDGAAHGCGAPDRLPDVCISFGDRRVARAAIRGELDSLAALGKGEMTVTGLIPLADALQRILDRLSLLFARRTA
jgi:hypothetical protein